MAPINTVAMALMPISQSVAWYAVVGSGRPLYSSVCGISAFYCGWALYKRFIEGESRELGHISMGCLALATFLERRYLSMAGTGLVLANFAVPVAIILPWSAKKIANTFKGQESDLAIVWANVFKLYLISNICLFGTILYKLFKLPSTGYAPVSSSSWRQQKQNGYEAA
jgi:hypothetical protein